MKNIFAYGGIALAVITGIIVYSNSQSDTLSTPSNTTHTNTANYSNYSATNNNSYSSPSYSNSSSYSGGESSNSSEDNADKDDNNSDGTHSATVEYYNPSTGYNGTYTLDVEVEDGQVQQINFPNGGYLNDDHITPGDLDEDGHVTIDGEDGKTYDVQLDDNGDN